MWTIVALALGGCERPRADRPADPLLATAENHAPAEAPLRSSVVAPQGSDLVVEKVVRQQVPQSVSATGWLAVRPGSEVVVKAPASGFILPPEGQKEFGLGSPVGPDGKPLGLLKILPATAERAALVAAKKQADGLLEQSLAALQRAEAQLSQVKGKENTVADTRMVELQETADRARLAYQEAQQKLPMLPEEPTGNFAYLKPTPLPAPIAGRIVKVHVCPRQLVTAGDPLWTVADWSSLWVRVPVFVGDLCRIVRRQEAHIQVPGSELSCAGKPVEVPQPIEEGHRTVDLYYQIDNIAGILHPGKAMTVVLPAEGVSEQLVVRSAAILSDGTGSTWAYVQTGPHDFRRRRVEPGEPLGALVAIQRGLHEGEAVVTKGAETLYAEELKSETPAEDE